MGSREALRHAVAEMGRADLHLLGDACTMFDDVAAGRYTVMHGTPAAADLRDLVLQTRNSSDPRAAGLVALYLHAWVVAGQAAWAAVPVAGCPYPDDQTEANAALLTQLPSGIGAHLWGGAAPFDGWVGYEGCATLPVPFEWEPRELPLEVGTVDPEVLARHVVGFGGFVRWPYNHDHLYLYRVDRELWEHMHQPSSHP